MTDSTIGPETTCTFALELHYFPGCHLPSLMMEAARTSETSVDNHFTRQYNPEDSSEHSMNKLQN
jgi:hypothetical protein